VRRPSESTCAARAQPTDTATRRRTRCAAGSAATILCPYDSSRLEPGIVGFAARTHPVIDEDSGRRASPAYTEPDLVIAQLNQPLPEPQAPTRDLVFDAYGLRAVCRLTGEQAAPTGTTTGCTCA
jgi:hypothetical protein